VSDSYEEFEVSAEHVDNVSYWLFLKEVIDVWMQYLSKKKLYINVTYEETYHKVAHVVAKYYDGNTGKIKKAEQTLSCTLNGKLERFEKYCSQTGVKPVTRDWLYQNVQDGKKAASYRSKIDRRINNGASPVHPENL